MSELTSVYKATVEYYGYSIYFFFSDPLEAVKYKTELEKERPDLKVVIQHFKTIKEVSDNFMAGVLEIIQEVDKQITERRESENLFNMPCKACD
jgi:hypothetical protein